MPATLVVQKFGGSSVADADRIKRVARRIARERAAGNDLVALGHLLQKHGFTIGENADYGDDPQPGDHSSTGYHYLCHHSGALDVNVYGAPEAPAVTPPVRAEPEPAVPAAGGNERIERIERQLAELRAEIKALREELGT